MSTREMTMKVIRSKEFRGTRPWDAAHVATMDGVSVRLHWADQPYIWHVNDGQEVFAVMDGLVDMHYRLDGIEKIATLEPGDMFYADIGCEHVAHPRVASRILVIEKEGSV
jgi:mannose-6-phosphate isomerase-like protein (cupin superfamily)